MPRISRRNLIATELCLSTSSLVARTTWSRPAEMLGSNRAVGSVEPVPAGAPREQLLFDNGWKFKIGHGTDPSKDMGFRFCQCQFAHMCIFAVAKARFDDSDWRTLNLPHDWAVELPFVHDDAGTGDNPLRSHGYKPLGRRYPETSVGWYRRERSEER